MAFWRCIIILLLAMLLGVFCESVLIDFSVPSAGDGGALPTDGDGDVLPAIADRGLVANAGDVLPLAGDCEVLESDAYEALWAKVMLILNSLRVKHPGDKLVQAAWYELALGCGDGFCPGLESPALRGSSRIFSTHRTSKITRVVVDVLTKACAFLHSVFLLVLGFVVAELKQHAHRNKCASLEVVDTVEPCTVETSGRAMSTLEVSTLTWILPFLDPCKDTQALGYCNNALQHCVVDVLEPLDYALFRKRRVRSQAACPFASDPVEMEPLTLQRRESIINGIVDGAIEAMENLATSACPRLLPGIACPDTDLSVKVYSNPNHLTDYAPDAEAIAEALKEFGDKVRQSHDQKAGYCVAQHAFIMCRVDTGMHCFGMFLESMVGGSIKVLVYDPSHDRLMKAFQYLDENWHELLRFTPRYELHFMMPMWYFEPSSQGKYKGLGATFGQMMPGIRQKTQLALHKETGCGMLSYFAMSYFLKVAVASGVRRPLFESIGLQPVSCHYVLNTVWDGNPEKVLESEAVPESRFQMQPDERARLARAKHFSFSALAFPKEFQVFSEFTLPGEIVASGIDMKTVTELRQRWLEIMRRAGLAPRREDGPDFKHNCYLKLLVRL